MDSEFPDNSVIISPHCDDVALSLGNTLSQRNVHEKPLIVTVFSVSNYSICKESLSEIEITKIRHSEEQRVAELLQCNLLFGGFREPLLREGYDSIISIFHQKPVKSEKIYNEVYNFIYNLTLLHKDRVFIFPLGIGSHVDHRIINEIAIELINNKILSKVYFYPDLPYIIKHHKVLHSIITHISKKCNGVLNRIEIKVDEVSIKTKILKLYESQLSSSDITLIEEWHKREPEFILYLSDI